MGPSLIARLLLLHWCVAQLLMGFNCFLNCMVVMILYGLWIAGLHCFVCALGCTVLCLLLILSRRFLLLGIEFDVCTKLAKEYYSWYDRRKPCTVTSSVFPVLQTILVPVCIFSCWQLFTYYHPNWIDWGLKLFRLAPLSCCNPGGL